jgi:hypothetical protein
LIRDLHEKSGIFHVPSAAYHSEEHQGSSHKSIGDPSAPMLGGKKP